MEKYLLAEFIKLGLFSTVVVGSVYFILKKYMSGYLDQKSKNLATKEDVGEITNIVETIKSENAHVLEELKAEHAAKLEDIRRENQVLISKLDKHLALKIKVYTDAIEAFTTLGHNLLELLELQSHSNIFNKTMMEAAKIISKIRVVGSNETCNKALEAMAIFNKIAIELQNKRVVILVDKDRLELLQQKETLEENESEELDKLIDSQLSDSINMAKLCLERHNEFSCLVTHFVFSARKELGLEINEAELIQAENHNTKSVNESFESFINDMENMQ